MPLTAPFLAGGIAVAIPTAIDANRTKFLKAYFKEHAGQVMFHAYPGSDKRCQVFSSVPLLRESP